ncbi:MAG TPA: hypothetical protein PKD49_14225 [Hyphomicrobium sp.]|nr:hypothetical protein [Hyphomicrobium sp.]
MIGYRSITVALLAAGALASPALASKYDGHWSMIAQTTRGHCGVISVGFGIQRGHIYATDGSFAFHPIKLSGRVATSGRTRMTAVTGPRVAHGSGRFTRVSGRGTWNGTGPSGRCSGVWNATRF